MRSILEKFVLSTITALLMCTMTTGLNAASEWDYYSEVDGNKARLTVEGKSWTYWKLDKTQPTKIKIMGPAKLKVYTRAVLPIKKKEDVYGIVTLLDGDKRYYIGRATEYSKSVKNPRESGQRIGEARSIYFDVPAGEHVYDVSLHKDAINPVYARFYIQSDRSEKVSWIAYLPRNHTEEVRVSVKEREYIYYRTSKNAPVELDVIGPIRIRCIARLEFDHTMRGERLFRVQVMEDQKVLMTKALTGMISGTATYSLPSEYVVGKGENFYIEVPSGKHRLEVNTPDSGISILFRFYLPEKALGNKLPDEEVKRVNSILGKLSALDG